MNAPPPLPTAPARPRARVGRWFSLALAGLVVVAVGRYAWSEARREDTPERYARLCDLLLETLPLESATKDPKLTSAESTVRLREVRRELDRLARDTRQLAPIATDFVHQLDAVEQLSRRPVSLSQLALSGIEIAAGFGLHSTDMIESGSKGAFQELRAAKEIWDSLNAIREGTEIARVRLADAAPKYSGPAASEPLIEAEFTEEQPGLLDRIVGEQHSTDAIQTLRLKNVSRQSLSRCVIKLRLVRPDGKSFVHVYYVETWPNGESRRVRFAPHALFDETDIDVDRIQINLAAREKTSPEIILSRAGATWPYAK